MGGSSVSLRPDGPAGAGPGRTGKHSHSHGRSVDRSVTAALGTEEPGGDDIDLGVRYSGYLKPGDCLRAPGASESRMCPFSDRLWTPVNRERRETLPWICPAWIQGGRV